MTKEEMREWVEAYIKVQEEPDKANPEHSSYWAVEKFLDLSDENPELCFKAILQILHREPNEKVIGILAAGPLEDLIEDHGTDFISEIESEARLNPAFRHLLGGVWECTNPEIWNRVLKARNNKSW